ncbi:hypothetical protein MesoLjLc_58420 [Mesorhizobium sp. L-8-10]|uniref:pYEATS domain-containing protein n=1 Tax=unclassified Mesorhizobium TaxID=325217 RepID=UPI001927DCEF|nr:MULTISPECIES: pYEATS domain-containing protein [unclassified Mesorhizobium]BCH25928.1 hypothetical protein MesoLjLb_57130 [Mesorhizobium sp. L-8-3]BCH33912.1 hypothetical protein MesoLjLc_58420 [Mesorhizobium sp. L-8-10]
MYGNLNVTVRDSLFNPNGNGGPAWKNSSSDQPLYQVHIYLEGQDLPYVRSATYELHPSFRERVKRIIRTASNPNCLLTIWTWGIFEVGVAIEDKRGQVYNLKHNLRYGEEISRTPESKFQNMS